MAQNDKINYKGKHDDMYLSPAFPMGKGDDVFTVSGPIMVACNPGEGKDMIVSKYKNGGKDLPEIFITEMDKNDRIKFQGKGRLDWQAGFYSSENRFSISANNFEDTLISASGTGLLSPESHVV